MLRVNKTSQRQKKKKSPPFFKKERKASFYLCEGRQNNLLTPECVLCLEFFPSIVIMCYLNHQINMKRSFHVLMSPEGGFGLLAFHLLCLNPVTKNICHPFFFSQVMSGMGSLQRPGLWWASGKLSLDLCVLFALENQSLFFFLLIEFWSKAVFGI